MSKFLLNAAADAANTSLSNLNQNGINRIQQIAAGGSGSAVLSVNSETGIVVLDTSNIADTSNFRYVTDANLSNVTTMLLNGNTLQMLNVGQTTPMQIQPDTSDSFLNKLNLTSQSGTSVVVADGVSLVKRVNGVYGDVYGELYTTLASQSDVAIDTPISGNILSHNGLSWYNATVLDLDLVTYDGVEILKNKTITDPSNSVAASQLHSVVVSNVAPVTGQVLKASSATNAVWSNAPGGSLANLSDVTLTAPSLNDVLTYDGSDWVNTNPLDNLSLPTILQDKQFQAIDGSVSDNAYGFYNSPGAGMSKGNTELLFAWGGVAASDVRAANVGIYNGASRVGLDASLITSNQNWKIPDTSDSFLGVSTVATQYNKTMDALTNDVAARRLQNVSISGVAPSSNQVLQASNSTNASWVTLPGISNPSLASLNDVTFVNVQDMNLISYDGITNKWTNVTSIISDQIVTTLLYKNLESSTNLVTATSLRGASNSKISVNTAPASIGNVLTYSGTNVASWVAPSATIPSLASLQDVVILGATAGELLSYSGTSWQNVQLSNSQIPSALSSKTLTSSTIDDVSNTVRASKLQNVSISGTAPSASQILQASSATNASWVTPSFGSTTLSGLTDVNITSPLNLQLLTYNTSTSKWVNADITSGQLPANIYSKNYYANNGVAIQPSFSFTSFQDLGLYAASGTSMRAVIAGADAVAIEPNSVAIYNTSGTNKAVIQSGCTGTKTYILNDMVASSDAFVMQTALQGLSNKLLTSCTIDSASNTVTSDALRNATGTVSVSASSAPSVGQTLVATSATTATWQTPGGGSSSFTDAAFQITNSVDTSKIVKFSASVLPTATSITYTMPSTATGDVLVSNNNVATISNKVFRASDGTISNAAYGFVGDVNTGMFRVTLGQLMFIQQGANMVGMTGAGLTVYNSNTTGVRLNPTGATAINAFTFPNVNGDTLVAAQATQTLTNKTTQNALGTSSAPTYSFTGDTTSGFYRESLGNIGLTLQATVAIRFTSAAVELWRAGLSTAKVLLSVANIGTNIITWAFPLTTTSPTAFVGDSVTQTITNKTMVDVNSTSRADRIATTGSSVVISATAPAIGMSVIATSSTAASWSRPKQQYSQMNQTNSTQVVMTFAASNTYYVLSMGTIDTPTVVQSSASFLQSVAGSTPSFTYSGVNGIDLQVWASIRYKNAGNTARGIAIFKNSVKTVTTEGFSQTGNNTDVACPQCFGVFQNCNNGDIFTIYVQNLTNTGSFIVEQCQFMINTLQQQF